MDELNPNNDVNQIVTNIKEEIILPKPSNDRIITYLHDLRTKEEFQSLSDSQFYDIVGETFNLNPEYFMKSIYEARKLYEHVDEREMAGRIIKKYSLYDGEKILYECYGDTILEKKMSSIKVSVSGYLFVTNYRIIAQGTMKTNSRRDYILKHFLLPFSGISKRTKIEKSLPCYGYQFPVQNHVMLQKKSNVIKYKVMTISDEMRKKSTYSQLRALGKVSRVVKITLPFSKDITPLFEVLCKNVKHTIDTLREFQEMGLKKKFIQNAFLFHLKHLWKSEEYKKLSDSEYLEIIKETYKLDPEIFMVYIYPKMKSWKFPSFLRIKKELFETLDKFRNLK